MRLSNIKKVYVCEYKGMYKIGIAHKPQNRLKQLKCGCPTARILYESNYIKNCFFVENILHKTFEKYKIDREWFSFLDILLIDKTVNELGEIVEIEKVKEIIKLENDRFSQKMDKQIKKMFSCKQNKTKEVCLEINFEKGWKLKEKDKNFLVNYFTSYADYINKYCCGDGAEEIDLIIKSLKEKGVESSKDLIQENAKIAFEAVNGEIYEYYNNENSKDTLYIIENSILS